MKKVFFVLFFILMLVGFVLVVEVSYCFNKDVFVKFFDLNLMY